ncbi:hypothetical protein BHS07_20915 [Myxococcus xanthus]|nr:hypothetical protein BHS07_20915 [Myxococcus xanthus]
MPRWRAAGLTGVFTVTAGRFHTAAMSPEGAGWVWGRNSLGQVGDGTTADRPRPVNVMVQEETLSRHIGSQARSTGLCRIQRRQLVQLAADSM